VNGKLLNSYAYVLRIGVFLYVILLICPIRYWPLSTGVDETWRFAINQAYAEGFAPGSEVIFTSGPLGYLTFPENIGSNLWKGLTFQACLWILLSFVFADLFFRVGISLRNLTLFSLCLCLSAYLYWFDFVGLENLILASALVLLTIYRMHGGLWRYCISLALIGVLPFIKLSAALFGVTAVLGFLVFMAMQPRQKSSNELTLAVVIPVATACVLSLMLIPSWASFFAYVRGSVAEVIGFGDGMVIRGPVIQLVCAFLALTLLAIMTTLPMNSPKSGAFYLLFLAGPMFLAFKHGFVRQDSPHVAGFFCYVALALGLVSLNLNLQNRNALRPAALIVLFVPLWLLNRDDFRTVQLPATVGLRSVVMVVKLFPLRQLGDRLKTSTNFPEESRIEPEIARAIGDSAVGSLSLQFSNLAAAGLQTALYPAVQRYNAYTPYLDGLDADWIRGKGPRFLVFDGQRLEIRDSWADTPATWLEVYRWYDYRLLSSRNLLLERRSHPRFNRLDLFAHFQTRFPGSFHLPHSQQPVFWSMECNPNISSRLVNMLFRPPEIFMSVRSNDGNSRESRVIPEMLAEPILGNFLPGDLEEFSRLFQSGPEDGDIVDEINLSGSGLGLNASTCQVSFLSPT
jgi:hypothetical protein